MKKLYFFDESERERIINLHESATKKQYLILEQAYAVDKTQWDKYPCVTTFPSANRETLKDGTSVYRIGNEVYYNNGRRQLVDRSVVDFSCQDTIFVNSKPFICASKVQGAELTRNAEPNIDAYLIGGTYFYSNGFKYTPGAGGKLNYDCNDPLLKGGGVQASPEQNKNTKTKGYAPSSDIIKKLQDEIVKYDPTYKPTGTLDQTTLDALNKLLS
jgi:hypothetical protein